MAEYSREPLRPGLLAITRDDIGKILIEQRRGLVSRDQPVRAICIKLQPDMAEAYSELGYANRNLKKYPEALAAYNQAVSHDPKYAPAHHGLGMTYFALGNKAAAQEQYRTLQTLDAEWAKKLYSSMFK